MRTFFRGRRGRWRLIALLAAVVIVASAAAAEYELTVSPSAHVTVTGGTVAFEEGRTGFGGYWIVPHELNFSGGAEGFPAHLGPGGTLQITVPFSNTDSEPHALSSVEVTGSFGLVATNPALPVTVAALQDASLELTLRAPSTAGTYGFSVTIVCLS
ncbi:MAG: hypothetical protein ACREC5_05925 [Thermoplasmata archaeon]